MTLGRGSKPVLYAGLLLAITPTTACANNSEHAVTVKVSVVAQFCPNGSKSCRNLPVPDAEVTLSRGSTTLKSGRTSGTGEFTAKIDKADTVHVAVKSMAFTENIERDVSTGTGAYVEAEMMGTAAI